MNQKQTCRIKALGSQSLIYTLVALLVISDPGVRADEPVPAAKANGFSGICSPIVMLPQSTSAMIARKFFPEEDYELAILPSLGVVGVEFYSTYLIRRNEQGFECCIKRIDPRRLIENERFSPELIEKADLEIRSARIDAAAVEVLSEFLRTGIAQAVYHSRAVRDSFVMLDGESFNVFVKGGKKDAYPNYSGCVQDGLYANGSRSCATIVHTLSALVLGGDGDPLKKLVEYLKESAQGEAIPPDPFFRPPAPVPDIKLPPIE
jgi:hypothetical protein